MVKFFDNTFQNWRPKNLCPKCAINKTMNICSSNINMHYREKMNEECYWITCQKFISFRNFWDQTLIRASIPPAIANPLAQVRARSSFHRDEKKEREREKKKRSRKKEEKCIATERNATSKEENKKENPNEKKSQDKLKNHKTVGKFKRCWDLEARTVSFPSGIQPPCVYFPRLSPTRLARAGCHFRLAFVRPSVWPLVRPRPPFHSCLRHSTARVLFFILILRIFGNARAGVAGVTINYKADDRGR